MSIAMHLVTDRDAGDPVGAEVLARLGTALPDASVTVTRVARGNTLEAGAWVARLAGGQSAAGSLVAHDVAWAPGQPAPGRPARPVPRAAVPPLPERVWLGAPAKRTRARA